MDVALRNKLMNWAEQYETAQFIEQDPVQFPRMYTDRRDIEVVAFLTATIAWGNRKQIINSCNKLFHDIMQDKPYEFVRSGGWKDLDPSRNIHRTFFCRDLAYMCKGLNAAYRLYPGTLEGIFAERDNVWEAFSYMRKLFIGANGGETSRHFSNPDPTKHNRDGATCKRLNLALRWLVRTGSPVDLGIWTNVSPDKLIIPLDTHVHRMALELGITSRKGTGITTAEEITHALKEVFPNDPVRGDFALFGYGVEHKTTRK